MKQHLRFLLILAALLFSFSCTKEVPAELNVTTTELSFTKDGGSQSISFSTNKDWTASSSASWAKVTSSGSSSATSINVTVEANTDYDDRTATITIKAENLTKTVNIKQSTNLGLIVSKKDFDLTNEAQSIEVEVQANVEFEVSIDDACKGWITKAETKGLVSNKIIFNIAKNETYDNREGKIVVKQKNSSLSETVTVKQGQTNGLFLTKSEYAISCSEHDITVEVKANVEFAVTSEADWITYVETKGLNNSDITLKAAKNETANKRIGTVKVKQINGSLEGVITITQEGDFPISIPDANFKAHCVKKFDKNGDGEINSAEASAVEDLIIENCSITSLVGIEYFTSLRTLRCGGNKIASLDLSKNTALQTLHCEDNNITSLDLSKNTALYYLSCYRNQLTSLDLSNNIAMTYLNCWKNQLTSLNVSNCTAITNLCCESNQLTSIDVSDISALFEINCKYNKLTSLNVSKNTELKRLLCCDNQLTSLDVSKNTALTTLNCTNNSNLTELWLKTGQTINDLQKDDHTQIKYKD